MKKFLAALLIGLSLVSITLDASAARLGGGASFGRSMSVPKAAPSTPFKAPSAAATKRPATAAAAGAAAKAPMSMGKRLLIGAAAALGFMALANMLGLGEGFAQMLMILTLILLAVVAFRFFAARKSGASAAASAGAPASQPTQDADFGQSRSEAATPTEYVASVLFTGSLKENGEPTEIKEIWNLVKPKEGKTGWLLAGIQQA